MTDGGRFPFPPGGLCLRAEIDLSDTNPLRRASCRSIKDESAAPHGAADFVFSGDRKGRNYDEDVGPALPGGIQEGARRPPLAVSNGEVLRRGRIRNLPLLRVFSFATFLWTSKEKLTTQVMACEQAADDL